MPGPSSWRGDRSTRRDFIKVGAVGGAAFLAGCTSGSDGDEGEGDTRRFRVFDPEGTTPSQRHFNPWNTSQPGAWHPGAAVFDRLAVYSPASDPPEAFPLMAEEWEMEDDTTLAVTLSEDWTWHNGDQFVAADYVMEQQIELGVLGANKEEGERAHQVMESIEEVDDQFFRVHLHEPLSEIFAVQNTIGDYHGNLGRGVFTKHDDDQWSEWHEKIQNAEGDELDAVIEEITTTKYPMIDSDDAIGNGPFKMKTVGDDVMVMEKYEDHPNADNINFDEFALKVFTDTQQVFQPYSSGQVDATHSGFPVKDSLDSQLPNGHQLFREGRSANNLFAFNCGHGIEGYDTPFDSPNVRKAVAHIYDRQQATQLLEGERRLFEFPPCRVPHAVLEQGTEISGIDIQEEFTLYGENDTERAAELLQQEGYEQDGDQWLTPDGDAFEINIMNGAERPDIQILRQNLEEFGITANQQQVDDATFGDRRNKGDYHLMPDGSSANGVSAMWALGLVPDWIQSITHFEPEVEIPMPIGDPEGSSGTKTINVEDHIRQWMATSEDQYHQELMWWWNQHLPEAEFLWRPDAGAINTTNWELDVRQEIRDGVDDALYIAPKMADGTIRYKE